MRFLGRYAPKSLRLYSGDPIASTFIFSFTEVFANVENMPGDMWGTLLALVWTQYQYILCPMIFGYLGVKLLFDDWQHVIKQKGSFEKRVGR